MTTRPLPGRLMILAFSRYGLMRHSLTVATTRFLAHTKTAHPPPTRASRTT